MKNTFKEIAILLIVVLLTESLVVSTLTMSTILNTLGVWNWNGLSKSMFILSYIVGLMAILSHIISIFKKYKQ